MGKAEIERLEETLREVFAATQWRRKQLGLAPLEIKPTVRKRGRNKGARWTGLQSYRVTAWFPALEYADLLRLAESFGMSGNPTKALRKLVRDAKLSKPTPITRAPLADRLKLHNGHARRAA